MEPRRLVWLCNAALFGVLALAGCAARSVDAFLERGADFTQYRRYAWGPADRTATGDPRLDGNQIFQERIRGAVEKQLAARGFQKSPTGTPELWVHFHASVEQRIDLSDFERPQTCEDCRPFIYDAGSLVIDLVDARTDRLLWRGWSESNVSGVIDNQRWMEERIDEGVTKIFEKFPRQTR
jgi:hypothetical protein